MTELQIADCGLRNKKFRIPKSEFRIFFITGLISFCSCLAWAGPSAGRYELYDGNGQKTGTIVTSIASTVNAGKTSWSIMTTTDLKLSRFNYKEEDTAEIGPTGLTSFRRRIFDNGTEIITAGSRQDKMLLAGAQKGEKKVTYPIDASSYDATEYELDLPQSPTATMKPGERKTLRVFYVETLRVFPTTRDVSELRDVDFNGKDVSVTVVKTSANGKTITAWFDQKTGKLLQEEGENYVMTRVGD
jgi:hypothetical protein